MKTTDSAQVEKIVLAGGCFWGTQRLLSLLHGVRRTRVGFANSEVENPAYKEVCTGATGAAEAVEVEYNATVVDLSKLLDFFLKSIDPTAKDRQGNDLGSQYRTGIYYATDPQKRVALEAIERLQKKYEKRVVTEVLPLKNFYEAEPEHQDYLGKNPGGYCHVSRELMAQARHTDILKPEAPKEAAHADSHHQLYGSGAVYPDTGRRDMSGE